jgi:TonB family protein
MKRNIIIVICSVGFLIACNQNNVNDSTKEKKSQGNVNITSKSHIKEKLVSEPKDLNPTISDKKQNKSKVLFAPPVVVPEPGDGKKWPEPIWQGDDGIIHPPDGSDGFSPEKPVDEEILSIAEVYPEFNGGQEALLKYLQENIFYPVDAKENGFQGKVYIQFVVFKDGHLSDFKILKGIYPSIDQEALRAVRKMPNWIPGQDKGKTVNVKVVIPVVFKLS